jgi:predicted phosphodiesterase
MGQRIPGKVYPCDQKAYDAYIDLGDYQLAADKLGVSKDGVKRGVRRVRATKSDNEPTSDRWLQELKQHFSVKELQAMIKGKKSAQENHTAIHDFGGEEIVIGVLSDTHIGSKYTNNEYIYDAFRAFDAAGVDLVCHAGDVCEGMSNRAGHVLECTDIGYNNQRTAAVEVLKSYESAPMYFISGNHDDWFKMSNGACIVSDICEQIPNATFLGHSEGNIQIGATQVRLWHGLDGSSYAHSYRIQKIVESLTGGDKPQVLIAGHTHKAFYVYERHVHCVSAGCIQKQSSWMRGKRLSAHTGFWILRMTLNELGVGRMSTEWFPLYV